MRPLLILLALATGCARGSKAPAGARVVSLTPSATEVVAALGATSMLVGVDDYSRYPPEVTKLPHVGSFLQPNLEAIVRLHPTLVILDDVHGPTAQGLADAHVPTVECPMHALADVRGALRAVGARLGKAREADSQIAAIDAALAAARDHRPAHHPRVLAIIDREAGGLGNSTAAGPGSWLDDLLAAVGADNVLAASPARYPKVSLETMLRAQPDVILDVSGQDPKAWSDLDVPAVKAGRVVALPQELFGGPTPRVAQALEQLGKIVRSSK
ncbi:MAG: ABC transporter substrate-binding protein [Acidobacteriota bacterium]